MNRPRWIIGIDPDVERSGFVVLDSEARHITFAGALTFPEVITHLHMIAQEHAQEMSRVLIVIEDSDTATNWHLNKIQYESMPLMNKLRKAAAIGRSAGMCHATLRHLQEVSEGMGLTVRMQQPLRKLWNSKDGKMSQAEALQFMPGLPSRCNQEVRDAALLAWCEAELPIRINPTKK